MSKIYNIYRRIRGISDPAVDRSMAAALPTADARAVRLLALLLLQRRDPDGLTGLVLNYHHLPQDIQHTIAGHTSDLFRALRQAASRRDTQGPANAVQIIRRSLDTRLAYLVAQQLRQPWAPLQELASQCLLEMAQRCATDPESQAAPAADADSAAYLQDALADSLQAFGRFHQQQEVLLAAARMLPRPWAELMALLADPRHPTTAAWRRMLQEAQEPAFRRAIPLMLPVAGLAEACLAALEQCASAGTLGDVLAQHHLLLLPGTRKAMQRLLKDRDDLWPASRQTALWSPHQTRGLPLWAMSLPAPREIQIQRLLRLRHLPDTATRLGALRRLMALAAEPLGQDVQDAQDAVVQFCDDADETLARLALRCLISRRYHDLPRLLARLVNSPHPSIRQLAAQALAPIGFARLWEAWPDMDEPRRLATGRALIKIDPNFHRALSEKLLQGDRQAKLRALSMIHGLNQGSFFEKALVQLAEDADERIASAAVKALGSVGTQAAADTLHKALEHADSRVRANAVEALTQLESTQHVQKLLTMAQTDDNRPRANAIQALMQMRTSDALHALMGMLADARPAHRRSALWLVESGGLMAVARHVAEMAVSDPDPQVRVKADQVFHDLIHHLACPIRPSPDTDHAAVG